jgi:hypothetical protein
MTQKACSLIVNPIAVVGWIMIALPRRRWVADIAAAWAIPGLLAIAHVAVVATHIDRQRAGSSLLPSRRSSPTRGCCSPADSLPGVAICSSLRRAMRVSAAYHIWRSAVPPVDSCSDRQAGCCIYWRAGLSATARAADARAAASPALLSAGSLTARHSGVATPSWLVLPCRTPARQAVQRGSFPFSANETQASAIRSASATHPAGSVHERRVVDVIEHERDLVVHRAELPITGDATRSSM